MEQPVTSPAIPRVFISQLTFSDGTEVPLSPNDIELVVGPNNAGKSAALRGVRDKLGNSSASNPVLQNLTVQKTGTRDDFITWLLGWTVPQMGSLPDNPVYQALGLASIEIRLTMIGSGLTMFWVIWRAGFATCCLLTNAFKSAIPLVTSHSRTTVPIIRFISSCVMTRLSSALVRSFEGLLVSILLFTETRECTFPCMWGAVRPH